MLMLPAAPLDWAWGRAAFSLRRGNLPPGWARSPPVAAPEPFSAAPCACAARPGRPCQGGSRVTRAPPSRSKWPLTFRFALAPGTRGTSPLLQAQWLAGGVYDPCCKGVFNRFLQPANQRNRHCAQTGIAPYHPVRTVAWSHTTVTWMRGTQTGMLRYRRVPTVACRASATHFPCTTVRPARGHPRKTTMLTRLGL